MCAPAAIPLIMLAGTAASAGASAAQYSAQSSQANAATKFQNSRYSDTASIAMQNYLRTINQTGLNLQQTTAVASQQAMSNRVATEAAQGQAVTAAAESGIQGNSVQELLNDFARQEAFNNDQLHTQLQWQQAQADESLRAARTQAMGNVSSATPQPIQGPSPLGLGLTVGSSILSGVNSYADYARRQDPYANFPTKGN